MGALVYREDSLARLINDEIRTFVENFHGPGSNIIALLTFPMNLGTVTNKCIRYHAEIYNLAEFYVTMGGKVFMVVCQHRHIRPQYQFTRPNYNPKWKYLNADSKMIDPYDLHAYINLNIAESKRRSFGLNFNHAAITNKDEADEKSSVTNKDAEAGTSSVADRDAEDGESSVANTDAGAGTSSVDDTDEDDQNSLVADNNEEDKNSPIDYFNCFPTIFTSNMSDDASQISEAESKVFLLMIEQHQKTYYPTAPQSHPAQEQTLPANRPIYKFSEEPQPEDPDNMGDSLTSNPTDNASSVVQKLNVLALETVPEDTLTDDIGEYGQQFFEFKYFMDQVLECVRELPWDVPRFVKTRCDFEAYKYIAETELHSVVELYDIPGHYRTHHILNAFKFGARCVKWCDDTHALLIFTEKEHADKALLMEHPVVQVRAMINASPISTVIACMMNFPAVFQHLRNK